MPPATQLEDSVVKQLALRGLSRAPGPLAFVHRGNVVHVSISESLYRGLVVTVHDKPYATQQFRAHDGVYDWDGIAACIFAVVDRRHPVRDASGPRSSDRAPNAGLSIQPSPGSPGRMRVKLSEMDLDPLAAMQLYALVQHALPVVRRDRTEADAATL